MGAGKRERESKKERNWPGGTLESGAEAAHNTRNKSRRAISAAGWSPYRLRFIPPEPRAERVGGGRGVRERENCIGKGGSLTWLRLCTC